MDKKSLEVVLDAIRHAQNTVETLLTENFPYTDFEDSDIRDLFYKLNDMGLALVQKIEKIEGK